jgi:hypothetical protein
MTEAAALIQRLAKLEKQLNSFKEITGVDPSSGPYIVTTLSINRDLTTGGYFISFLSQPGETFQIQSSVDAVVWQVADNIVNAAAAPAMSSTWLSVPYAPEAIIYFRVRRYPRTLPLPNLNTPVNMSPPLADTPTLQQLLAMVASVQDQINALEYDADVSTRLRDIHTPTQLASALIEPGELILRLKAPITLPSGNTNIPAEKTIEFGLHWFIDGGGSTVSFFGKCVAERRTIFVGFVAKDIRGTFGGADVYPEWWGLVPNYHDIAINCAVKASTLDTNNFGIKVSLSNFSYDVSAPIDLSSMAVTLEGQGEGLTFLRSTANWNATWLKTDLWGTDTGPANHAAMVWIGGDLTGTYPYDNRTYRCQVIGMTISCGNAAFAHRADGEGGGPRRVSGISAKRWIEEGNAISHVTVTSASGVGMGFPQHKAMASIGLVGGYQAAVINGLSIRDFWITSPTFRDAYPMYFGQWTNNCSVDTGTVDATLSKSISSAYASLLSSTETITNPGLTAGTGWAVTGDWSITSGVANYTKVNPLGADYLRTTPAALVLGQTYTLKVEFLSAGSGTSLTVKRGATIIGTLNPLIAGTQYITFVPDATSANLDFVFPAATGTFAASITSVSLIANGDPTVYPVPAWEVTYPLIGIKAQGYMSISNVHFEGPVIGVHCEYNSSGGNAITLTNLNFLSLNDPKRSGVYSNDGRSGMDFANDTEVTTANGIYSGGDATLIAEEGSRYFGYGCGVLISKAVGNYETAKNAFDRVTINNIRSSGGVTYLLRDAMYGKNIRAYGQSQFPNSSNGGISLYSRGNAYAYTTTLPYTAIGTGVYDPTTPTSPASLSRTFFTGPIY